jgi:hypothetical protein
MAALSIMVLAGVIGAVIVSSRVWRLRKLTEKMRRDWGRARAQSDDLDLAMQDEAWVAAQAPNDRRSEVDSQTWSDLDLDEVVAAVDRTSTGVSQRILFGEDA